MKSEESKQPPSRQDANKAAARLSDVLTVKQLQLLQGQWIETPEQFLSIAATSEGQTGLCKLLDIEGDRLQAILVRLRKALPPEVVREVSSPKPGGALGVILTEDQIRERSNPKKGDEK